LREECFGSADGIGPDAFLNVINDLQESPAVVLEFGEFSPKNRGEERREDQVMEFSRNREKLISLIMIFYLAALVLIIYLPQY
jgi:hypothetical protein